MLGKAFRALSKREWLFLAVILLTAFALRLYFIIKVPQLDLWPDSLNYDKMARRIVAEGRYSFWGGASDAFITPGYPMFLAILYKLFWLGPDAGTPLMKVRGVQAILSTVSIFFFYLSVRRLAGVAAAAITAVLMTFYVSMVWAPAMILTETLFLFFFSIYLFLFLTGMEKRSWAWLLGAGVVFGLSVLVRPAGAPFLVLPLVYHFFVQRREGILKLSAVFAAGFVLAMLPWWLRNLVVLDQFIVLATGNGNPMLAGTFPYYGHGYETVMQNLQGVDQQALAIERIKQGFRTEFWLYLEWFTVGKWWYLFREPWDMPHAGFLDSWKWMHLPLVITGWIGVLFAWKWRALRLFALLLLGMTGLQLMFLPHERYGFSMMPLVIMLASMLVVFVATRLVNGRQKEGKTT